MILTPKDASLILTEVYKELSGITVDPTTLDSSAFVSTGVKAFEYGKTNVLNALGTVLGRTTIAVRPYDGKFHIIEENNKTLFGQRMRKISYYSTDPYAAGDFNTDLNGANLKDGAENHSVNPDQGENSATPSMFVQRQSRPVEIYFHGSDVWDEEITVYEYQLDAAFASPEGLAQFVNGMMVDHGNKVQMRKEAMRRMTTINYIAGVIALNKAGYMPGSAVNLLKRYNDEYGTNLTKAEIYKPQYRERLLKLIVTDIQNTSDYLTENTMNYHVNLGANDGEYLLRHTPKAEQRLMIFKPFVNEANAWVFPGLFNEQYVRIEDGEKVMCWQSPNDRMRIKCSPAVPDIENDWTQEIKADEVDVDVFAVLYDKDALMLNNQLESAASSPLEAKKMYRTLFWHFAKQPINDFSENGVVFYFEDYEQEENNEEEPQTNVNTRSTKKASK